MTIITDCLWVGAGPKGSLASCNLESKEWDTEIATKQARNKP